MAFTLGPRATSAGYRLESFDQVGSTNSEAIVRARAGERGPMWFVTTEQTAGRGRRQRPWIAPKGNLASSILETVDVAPASLRAWRWKRRFGAWLARLLSASH
jgi:BirA family biotin operon repressor/biotin-[acetyl-CoA-carboxylase] ligase